MEIVEIRCPIGPKRLFSKLHFEGKPMKITEGNLIEFSCDDCKRELRKKGNDIFRVLHRYDLSGELIESEAVRSSE